jgi:hypothetical protein
MVLKTVPSLDADLDLAVRENAGGGMFRVGAGHIFVESSLRANSGWCWAGSATSPPDTCGTYSRGSVETLDLWVAVRSWPTSMQPNRRHLRALIVVLVTH